MTGKEMEHYYGPLYLKTVWEGLKEALNGRRAVLRVFHQTYFAGGRFPFKALGDRSWQSSPGQVIRYALNHGLSGIPFWEGGGDLGGLGSFGLQSVDQERRIRLIPHTYTYWHIAHRDTSNSPRSPPKRKARSCSTEPFPSVIIGTNCCLFPAFCRTAPGSNQWLPSEKVGLHPLRPPWGPGLSWSIS